MQILVIEAEVGQGGVGDHGEVVDGAVRLESKGDEGVFDGVIAPMSFEGVVLPVLEIGDALRSALEVQHESRAFLFDVDFAVPRIGIITGIFLEGERGPGVCGTGLRGLSHGFVGFFLVFVVDGFECGDVVDGRTT